MTEDVGRRAFIGMIGAAGIGGGMAMASDAATGLTSGDTAAIEALIHGFEEAWNRHDMSMAAFGKLFSEDAHWVNVVGMHWSGRDEVVRAHAAYHATVFKTAEVHLRFFEIRSMGPHAAVAVGIARTDGFVRPDGPSEPAHDGRLSLFVMDRGAGWRIVHGHNTWIDYAAAPFDPIAGKPA
jgi:uncharacterized protein (TIGR02246 family)